MGALLAAALLALLVAAETLRQVRLMRLAEVQRRARDVVPDLDGLLASLDVPIPEREVGRRLDAAFRAFGTNQTAIVAAVLPLAGAGDGRPCRRAQRRVVESVLGNGAHERKVPVRNTSDGDVRPSDRPALPERTFAPEHHWSDAQQVDWGSEAAEVLDEIDRILTEFTDGSGGAPR